MFSTGHLWIKATHIITSNWKFLVRLISTVFTWKQRVQYFSESLMIMLVTYRVEYIQWICVAYVCIWLQEIIPFIDKQWENLTTQSRRTKQTWHATVAKTLVILGLVCYNHHFDQSLLSHAIIMICTRVLNQFQKYLLNAFELMHYLFTVQRHRAVHIQGR